MKRIYHIIVGLFLVTLLFACRNNRSNSVGFGAIKANPDLSSEFLKFYMKFHTDSVYQMEHVLFPLDGIESNQDTIDLENNTFKWEADNWQMHKPLVDPDGIFTQEYMTVDDKTVIEYIFDDKNKLGMERRFSKLSNDWYLIYYMGMNRMGLE